ncbi:hypothetical protein B0T25DRAFT_556892 [Lasiosphaeria hispida]|uniref:Uncharacterized protein n=1 Tax=Lasiosphaeria hispida TaxID=260671 RepID=A0AAJ0H9U8_9PEZI|nr:hypothetical protein B0T25DRAFT_556892 [Lasiosphaeria hispida]
MGRKYMLLSSSSLGHGIVLIGFVTYPLRRKDPPNSFVVRNNYVCQSCRVYVSVFAFDIAKFSTVCPAIVISEGFTFVDQGR